MMETASNRMLGALVHRLPDNSFTSADIAASIAHITGPA